VVSKPIFTAPPAPDKPEAKPADDDLTYTEPVKPAEPPAAQEAPAAPPEPKTPQQEFEEFMLGCGVKFDEFANWLAVQRLHPDPTSLSGWQDLPAATIERVKAMPKALATFLRHFGNVQKEAK
jgi:hypothetical protein